MGTRGRDLCLIPAAIQRKEKKIKGPKATRKQFTSSFYYCSVEEVYIQGVFPAKRSKMALESGASHLLAPQSAARSGSPGSPLISPSPGLLHPHPVSVSQEPQPLPSPWGAANLASASQAGFLWSRNSTPTPRFHPLMVVSSRKPRILSPSRFRRCCKPPCNSEPARGQDQLEAARHQQWGSPAPKIRGGGNNPAHPSPSQAPTPNSGTRNRHKSSRASPPCKRQVWVPGN